MFKKKEKSKDHLPIGKFFAWKSSDITSAGVFWIVTTYLTIFCTDYLGMAPATVGTIILISNVVDFFTDLAAAYIIDNTKTKLGKARPYELGILGMTICTSLLFMTPGGWSDTVKMVWVFCMYLFLFGVFNTLRSTANMPYLVRAFDNNTKLIGKVSSYGGFVTTMGTMVITLSFPKLMASMASEEGGWIKLILIYMIPLTVIGIFRFIFVKENPDVDAAQVKTDVSFKDIWNMVKKNGYAWMYLVVMLCFQTIQSIGALSYYFKYIVGDESLVGMLSIFSYILLPVMLIFPILLKKLSAAQIVAIAAIFSAVGYVINFFAGNNITMLIVGSIFTAVAMLPISYLGNMIMMDLCNYNQYIGLPRMDASIGALFNGFGTQLGQGIGGWLLGFVLTVSGYVAGSGDGVITQPESALTAIRLLYSLIPMAFMVILAFAAFGIARLSKKMPEIEAKIAKDLEENKGKNNEK